MNIEDNCRTDRRGAALVEGDLGLPTAHSSLCRQAAPEVLLTALPKAKQSLASGDPSLVVGAQGWEQVTKRL